MIGPFPFLMMTALNDSDRKIADLTVERTQLQDENTRLRAENRRLEAEVARLRSTKDRREIWP